MSGPAIRTIKGLHGAVEKELEGLYSTIMRDTSIDGNVADLLIDLSSKIRYMLKGRRCIDDAIGKAYDLARDIERAGKFAHRDDIAAIGEEVVQLILGYMRAYKDDEIFGMEDEEV